MTTKVTVNPRRAIGPLGKRVYGGFVEHLGRCIYGGLYEPGSALSDERGFRTDVLDLLRDLRVPVLRWPGGNFVSNYHWADGIGPVQERPSRPELAWGGAEPNTVGTDEVIAYCRALGAEPYICLNMGTGTLEEALNWVEYCNVPGGTTWSERRREGGHPEPYGVEWWGLGNEMYGDWQTGSMSAEEYIAEATRWARALRALSPGARFVACGESGWSEWDLKVAPALASLVELYSVHIYTGSEDYWSNLLAPHMAERAIGILKGVLSQAAYAQGLSRPPRIAYDEWNVWFRTNGGGLEERYAFQDALAVGTYLNIFVRNCDWVEMANLAQMVNAIAPIVTTPTAAVRQPIYHPLLLHVQGHEGTAVDCFVDGPTVEAPEELRTRWPHRVRDLGPFGLLDCASTVSSDGSHMALTVVNRSSSQERVVLDAIGGIEGPVEVTTLTAGGRTELADVEGVVTTRSSERTVEGRLELDLPASSFSLLRAPLAG